MMNAPEMIQEDNKQIKTETLHSFTVTMHAILGMGFLYKGWKQEAQKNTLYIPT